MVKHKTKETRMPNQTSLWHFPASGFSIWSSINHEQALSAGLECLRSPVHRISNKAEQRGMENIYIYIYMVNHCLNSNYVSTMISGIYKGSWRKWEIYLRLIWDLEWGKKGRWDMHGKWSKRGKANQSNKIRKMEEKREKGYEEDKWGKLSK